MTNEHDGTTSENPRAGWRMELLVFLAMATIFIVCGVAFWNPDGTANLPSPPTAPLTIDELYPSIDGVVEKAAGDGALEITLLQASPMYPASVVTELSRDALAVSERLQMFFPGIENKTVRFVAKVPPTPGNIPVMEPVPVLALDFDRSELMKMRIGDEFSFQEFLNRSGAVRDLTPTGRLYVQAFCRDQISVSAKVFCRREVG